MENKDKINLSIPVTVFGNLTPYNDVISKGRVRIFYKGLNRNNTYITEEFAEKLLSTISYTPICGIYSEEDGDFTDHGESRKLAKAYGVVPENPNITWEKHLDDDGVEREYACADVLLWTARYEEANKIPGKGQSMELYDKSIKGSWQYGNGKRYFKFTDGSFIGLTPLGDAVEPCFEGAAFYTLAASLEEMIEELKNYSKENNKNNSKGGTSGMVLNFKLSDSEKHNAIWSLLNTNFNEENNYTVDYSVLAVYDDYALVLNYEENKYYRVTYTKNDETNEVVLNDKVETFIVDVTASELTSLKAIQAVNNGSYELIDELYNNKVQEVEDLTISLNEKDESIAALTVEKENLVVEKEDLVATNNALVEEKETLTAEKDNLVVEKDALTIEKEALEQYKLQREKEDKEAIISQYVDKLDSEVIQEFSLNIDNYTKEDLTKELKVKLVDTNPALFSLNNEPLIPKSNSSREDEALSPAAKLLQKHRNKSKNGGNE